jgi:biotin synthase
MNDTRHDWDLQEVLSLFELPFNDLIFKSASIHRENFNPNEVQISTLLSIKTGSCPEDCKYCPQSAHYNTGLEKEDMMEIERVKAAAQAAKDEGASRFCMGAAWRNLNDRDLEQVEGMIKEVKNLGMETCVTLGMINSEQAQRLKAAGLDYYNHNLDSSKEVYEKVVTTRTYQDRLDTLTNVRDAGLNVCCGGIVGLGDSQEDRAKLMVTLANMPTHPQSVPINKLVKVPGTPLFEADEVDIFDFIRTIAVARTVMPKSYVRLSAGRESMNDQTQALCFLAGANSIFYGDKLLTTDNPEAQRDRLLLKRLGMQFEKKQCKIKEAA